MMTIEDRIRRLRAVMLTGRSAELEDFKRWIADSIPRYNLVHYFGVGGMGKSSLLVLLEDYCQQAGVSAARLDAAEHRDPLTAAVSLLAQLGNSGVDGLLARIVERYAKLEEGLRQERKVQLATIEQLSKLSVLTGSSEFLARDENDEPSSDHALGLDVLREVLTPDDLEFFSDPLPSISKALVECLRLEADNKSCVVVDTFEQASASFEAWLAHLVGTLGENVILITAGRLKLGNEWDRFGPVTRSVELRELIPDEASDLLRLHRVTDDDDVREILSLAGGHPLALKLCAEHVAQGLTLADGEGAHASIVERVTQSLLDGLSPELQEAVVICCALHWFNEELLNELASGGIFSGVVESLRRLPFVRQHGRGLAVHDLVRDFVNDDLRRRAPTRSRQVHGQAHAYFASHRDGLRGVESGAILAEVLYHGVLSDEQSGIREASKYFNDAADSFQAGRCDLIYTTVRDLPLSVENLPWIDYFAGVTAKLMVDAKEAHRRLRLVLASPASRVDSELRVYAGRWLAGSLWFAGEFDEVIAVATETLRLSRQLADKNVAGMKEYEHRALETLGLAQDRLGRFSEAIDIMSQLVDSSRNESDKLGEGWGLLSRGYFSWHAGDWDSASANLEACLATAREIGSDYMEVYPLGHLGLLHAQLGTFDASYWPGASQLLEECKAKALPAASKEMDSKASQNLAHLMLLMGRLQEARAHVKEALDLAIAMSHPYYVADCLRIAGCVETAEGDYERAAQFFERSLSTCIGISARYLVARGQSGRYEIAASRARSDEAAQGSAMDAFVDALDAAEGFPGVVAVIHRTRAYELMEVDPLNSVDQIGRAMDAALNFNRFAVVSAVSYFSQQVLPALANSAPARSELTVRMQQLISSDEPGIADLRHQYLSDLESATVPLCCVSLETAIQPLMSADSST